MISFFIDVFYLIIKIYESFKPTDLQNNHLVLNMWLGSSQNLKLQINNNGSRSSFSPNHHKSVGVVVGMANPLHVYGHWIFWTPITRKYGSTLGASFLTQSLGKSMNFLLLLSTTMMVIEGSMPANAGFRGHLSLGTMGMGFFSSL